MEGSSEQPMIRGTGKKGVSGKGGYKYSEELHNISPSFTQFRETKAPRKGEPTGVCWEMFNSSALPHVIEQGVGKRHIHIQHCTIQIQ